MDDESKARWENNIDKVRAFTFLVFGIDFLTQLIC